MSKYQSMINYFKKNYFDNKDLNSLTRKGHKYLVTLQERCPSNHEWEFNQWSFSFEGSKLKAEFPTLKNSERIKIECMFIGWLNHTYNLNKSVQS